MRPTFDEIRATEFPGASDAVYLNAASFGLLPARSRRELDQWARDRASGHGPRPERFGEALTAARTAAGRLVGAPASEVALVPNTSFGIQLAVNAVSKGPPGTILISDGEFPANVLPWKSLEPQGFTIEIVPSDADGCPDPEAMAARFDACEDLRALALSMVQFGTGVALPLDVWGARCREAGVFLAVDAIQGLGVCPVEDPAEMGIDVMACGAQKWLLSPWGTGFAWIHSRHLQTLPAPVVSWWGFESALDFEHLLDYDTAPLDDARRLEPATLPIQDMAAMARSIELLLELGIPRVRDHIHDLLDPLVEWALETPEVSLISPVDPRGRGGIVVLEVPDAQRWLAGLADRNIVATARSGRIRVAPHVYNTTTDMDRLLEALTSLRANG